MNTFQPSTINKVTTLASIASTRKKNEVVIDVVASDKSSRIVLSKKEKEEQVSNLVANDKWEGLGMELLELVQVASIQDLKQNTRDFLGKDDYKIGDLSKEIDSRVKNKVALLCGKDK
jgi:hypothetical protein